MVLQNQILCNKNEARIVENLLVSILDLTSLHRLGPLYATCAKSFRRR